MEVISSPVGSGGRGGGSGGGRGGGSGGGSGGGCGGGCGGVNFYSWMLSLFLVPNPLDGGVTTEMID